MSLTKCHVNIHIPVKYGTGHTHAHLFRKKNTKKTINISTSRFDTQLPKTLHTIPESPLPHRTMNRSSCAGRGGWPSSVALRAGRAASHGRSSTRWPSGSPASATACSPARRPRAARHDAAGQRASRGWRLSGVGGLGWHEFCSLKEHCCSWGLVK